MRASIRFANDTLAVLSTGSFVALIIALSVPDVLAFIQNLMRRWVQRHGGTVLERMLWHDAILSFGIPFVTGLLPLFWLMYRIMPYIKARRPKDVCVVCRYDLTGNVSGVCPECGMKIAEAK